MAERREPMIIGSRAFPCCGRRARLTFSIEALVRNCAGCRTSWRVEFVPASYATERLGSEVHSVRWTRLVRRGLARRAVSESDAGQLAFDLFSGDRDPRR